MSYKNHVLRSIKKRQGFTLVELLVVIAIIGLLAAISTVALGNAREKSRDARRKGDVKQLYTALNLYLSDEANSNGSYPDTGGDGSFICLTNTAGNAVYDALVTGGLMSALPEDPAPNRGDVASGCYAYAGSGENFKVMVLLEGDDTLMENEGGAVETRYEVFTPGSQAWTN